jgi:acetate kinase
MGFSTLDGAIMGTKSGSIDPTIITYIMEKEGKNALEVLDDLNTQSGILGLSEFSSKLSEIIENPNEMTNIAKNMYIRKIVDYIGSYYLLLDGIDVIVLSGNIGINNIDFRRELLSKLELLGIKIDIDNNNHIDELIKISSNDSKIQVYVIPSEEDSIILEDTLKLVRNG